MSTADTLVDHPLSTRRANPYVGPRAFQYGEMLNGRSREVAELRDIVVAERLVLLYSPSGAGKTSLLEAGLRPELEHHDFHVLPTIRVHHQLAAHAELDVANRYTLSTLLSLEQERASGLTLQELVGCGLADYMDEFLHRDDGLDPCLFFDQFEELFTLDPTDQAQKLQFLRELGGALRDPRRWSVVAMREDFIAQLDPYLGLLPDRLSARYRLDFLGTTAAEAAVAEPARQAGVPFAPAATRRLVDDLRTVRVQRAGSVCDELGPYVEPVQLQVVCRRLWDTIAPDATSIEIADVEGLGEVDDALAEFYEAQVMLTIAHAGVNERELRTWFDESLLTEQGFRAPVLSGPGRQGDQVLQALEDAHLIRADERRGTKWYELAHDRLVAPIRASNARWRETHLHPFQREAQAWDHQGRPRDLLITGALLSKASDWANEHPDELETVDRAYLEACHIRRKRRRAAVIAVSIALAVLVGLVLFAWQQAASARSNERRAKRAVAEANEARTEAESQRAAAEQSRTDAESQRAVAEQERAASEASAAEAERQNALATQAQADVVSVLRQTVPLAVKAYFRDNPGIGTVANAFIFDPSVTDPSCQSASTARSSPTFEAAGVETSFVNKGPKRVDLFWISPSGVRIPWASAEPGQGIDFAGGSGWVWMATDPAGQCLMLFTFEQ